MDREVNNRILDFSELQKCGGAQERKEISARCGLCNNTVALPSDRKVRGKVGYFKKSKLVAPSL